MLHLDWLKTLSFLEKEYGPRDIFARHFFATLPPAPIVANLRQIPTEDEWKKLVEQSTQEGFYKKIQEKPFNFKLHWVPLKRARVECKWQMLRANKLCIGAGVGHLPCKNQINPKECEECTKTYLRQYEKGLDVDLSVEIIRFVVYHGAAVHTIIIAAGDGDYKKAAEYIRTESGKEVQIVSWSDALAKDLRDLGTQPVAILDDLWEKLCYITTEKDVKEIPVSALEPEAIPL